MSRMIHSRSSSMNCFFRALIAAVLVVCVWSVSANAQNPVRTYTRADYTKWLEQYADAKPDFKPGDVLTVKDLERMRPFVIPGYLDYLNFPELKMKIVAPIDHTPHRAYVDCTEKYSSQVKLKPDGTLDNYVCGQPFVNSELKAGEPQSGLKAAWNWNWKWAYYGLAIYHIPWA